MLQIAPDWRQASTLKKAIEDKITKGNPICCLYSLPTCNCVSKLYYALRILKSLINKSTWSKNQCRWSNRHGYCCNRCWTRGWQYCSRCNCCSQEVKNSILLMMVWMLCEFWSRPFFPQKESVVNFWESLSTLHVHYWWHCWRLHVEK